MARESDGNIVLTAREEAIAERAAERALEKVYTQIGKSIITRLLWWAGAAGLSAWAWAHGKGYV